MTDPPPADGCVAGAILDKARVAVTTDRSKTHGDKERSFELIAELWSLYIKNRKDPEPDMPGGWWPLTAQDVALMMVLLKIARATMGTAVGDHFVDMAGYAAVAGELAQ